MLVNSQEISLLLSSEKPCACSNREGSHLPAELGPGAAACPGSLSAPQRTREELYHDEQKGQQRAQVCLEKESEVFSRPGQGTICNPMSRGVLQVLSQTHGRHELRMRRMRERQNVQYVLVGLPGM